jgi:TetR/AcrR family transcriptional regulator
VSTVSKAEATRKARIAVAARLEFARHGYAGARLQRIADRAGVNKQLVFYYFGSKTGLYRAVIEQSAGRLFTASVEPDTRATVHLSQEVRSAFAALGENPQLVRLLVNDACEEGAARDLASSVLSELHSRLHAIILKGQGLGYFRDNVDPDVAARQAINLIMGQLCLESARQSAPESGRGRSPTDSICDLLLRYLAW